MDKCKTCGKFGCLLLQNFFMKNCLYFWIPASALSECTESSSPRMKRSNKIDSNNSSVDNPEMKRRGMYVNK